MPGFITRSLSMIAFAALSVQLNCSLFQFTLPAEHRVVPNSQPQSIHNVEAHWIGHATVLLRIYDRWILTDPCFSQYLGPVKRFVEPAMQVEDLPELDWVLISHTHFDHLDRASLKALPSAKRLLVPAGGAIYIPGVAADSVAPVVDGTVVEGDGVRVTAVPAQHFGGRILIDNLWDGEPYNGYVIEYKDVTVYFAGDTGYNDTLFKKLGEDFDIDLALIPVGPSGGNSLLRSAIGQYVHVDPYEAVQAFKDTGARWMVPIHHSTFYRRGGTEMELILDSIAKSGISERILLVKVGESLGFDVQNDRATYLSRGESLSQTDAQSATKQAETDADELRPD
ncbi:MAG: MBL fold metallo-hydrolase [bacterium]|nr:MBL fold metallo-hydrolase [bacterium]